MSAGRRDDGGYPGEGFLARWSRRKRMNEAEARSDHRTQGVEQGAAPTPPASLPDAPGSPGTADRPPRCPETGEVIDEDLVASLPRLEDIRPGDDLSGFMRRGVPEALRRQALRRMWTTDPAIRDFVSPALDYAHDYNTPGAVVGFEPLSESELESARAMVGRMFSTPPEPERGDTEGLADARSDTGMAGGSQIGSGADRDMGSQPRAGDDGSPTGWSDGAAQRPASMSSARDDAHDRSQPGRQGADRTVLPDSAGSLSLPLRLQRGESLGAGPGDAVDERTVQPVSPRRRRRGGGATPV